jgi:hypothetical protein
LRFGRSDSPALLIGVDIGPPAPSGNGRISRRQDEPHAVVNPSKFESGAILTVMRSEYDRPVRRRLQ